MAKRIELMTSMARRTLLRFDFDCNPDVVTLIQTPAEQQKRVETQAVDDRRPTLFSYLCAGLVGPAS
jgi:hypothetical protein